MKRLIAIILVTYIFCGCSDTHQNFDHAIVLRQKILKAAQCTFIATVSADYIDHVYSFRMHCTIDPSGKMYFEVIEPESISGITGEISASQSSLTFDDKALAFAPLADGYISPVCAPWIFMQALQSGYIRGYGSANNGRILSIDDSYQDDALELEIMLDNQDIPISAEILWKGRKAIYIVVEDFTIQ